MIFDNITINYGFNGVGYTLSIVAGDNHNLPYDIAEAMHRVIEASGANLRIVIDELAQHLPPENPEDNELFKKGGEQ